MNELWSSTVTDGISDLEEPAVIDACGLCHQQVALDRNGEFVEHACMPPLEASSASHKKPEGVGVWSELAMLPTAKCNCLEHLTPLSQEWTEEHGEPCYEEWWRCAECGSEYTDEEAAQLAAQESLYEPETEDVCF